MTDAVTNVEIEDVLSSIRRLVSDKGRAGVREDVGRAPPNDFAAPDRLVLTQALRVSVPLADSDPSTGDEPAKDAAVALVSNRQAGAQDAWEQQATVLTEDVPVNAELITDAVVSDDKLVEELTSRLTQGPSEAPMTHVEFEPQSEIEPFVSEDGEVAEVELDQPDQADFAEVEVTESVEISDDQASLQEEQPGVDEPESAAANLENRIAEWEAVIASTDEQFEPDGAGDGDYAGTEVESLSWRDHSDPVTERHGEAREAFSRSEIPAFDPVEEVVVEAVASEVSEDIQSLGDDGYIDEDALRDLVGEIVRQELQGALGERITRNVRKLVRREIHRALAAGGLD